MATRAVDGAMSELGYLSSLNSVFPPPLILHPSMSSCSVVNARKHDTANAAVTSTRGGRSSPFLTSARRLSVSTAHPTSVCVASHARAPSPVAIPAVSSRNESAASMET